jgi:RNA polymerase sigma factor for flagellar operon FliA
MTVPHGRSWLDVDDLITAGIIGLIDALEKFDPGLGRKFSTYAYFRIRGAVLDELRAMDWVPRSVRQKIRELEQVYRILDEKLHRPLTDTDLARQLGVSLKQYHALLDEINVPPIVSLEELLEDKDQNRRDVLATETCGAARHFGSAFSELAAKESREILMHVIDALPEKERLVLTLYYYEELTMKEIAAILEVTESRVCQIHGLAVTHLRGSMQVECRDFVMS